MISKITPIIISTAVVATVSISVYLYLKKLKEDKIPTEWRKIGNITKLFIFPLKSGHYIAINEAECTEVGFRQLKTPYNPLQLRDRSFVVYNEKTKEIKSGRDTPNLVKIDVSVHDEYHIALDAPQMRTLYVRIPERNESSNIANLTVWSGESIEALDCGDEAARWISQHVSQKDSGYRLGYNDATKRRNLVKYQERMNYYKLMTDKATGLFSDVTSVLIVNQASVNDYLKKAPTANVTALNFRPNILIDDPNIKPYDEDNWRWIKIGDVIMKNVKECTRCVFTNVDPDTGKRNMDKEPLTTLAKYRKSRGPENAPIMGIHMEMITNGVIKTGDSVYVG